MVFVPEINYLVSCIIKHLTFVSTVCTFIFLLESLLKTSDDKSVIMYELTDTLCQSGKIYCTCNPTSGFKVRLF